MNEHFSLVQSKLVQVWWGKEKPACLAGAQEALDKHATDFTDGASSFAKGMRG